MSDTHITTCLDKWTGQDYAYVTATGLGLRKQGVHASTLMLELAKGHP